MRCNIFNKDTPAKSYWQNETLFHTEQPLCAKEVLAESEQYNVGCYHFLLARDAECSFIGSMERLYQRDGDQLQTEALAGTAFMSEDEHQPPASHLAIA